MKFENTFEVRAPVDEVYDALLDVERVAPCMPGAEVLERIDDDSYKVGIKVKLGPIAMKYKGQVEIVEKQPEAKRAVMKVRAKEARGQGMADATAAMSLEESGDVTKGTIETEVQLSGKAASMGQGVIQDVSGTLVKTFADNLAEMLSGGNGTAPDVQEGAEPLADRSAAEPAPAPPPSGAAQGSVGGTAAPPSGGQATADWSSGTREGASTGDDSLPLGAIAASVVKGRMRDPRAVALAVIAVLLFLLLLRRRR